MSISLANLRSVLATTPTGKGTGSEAERDRIRFTVKYLKLPYNPEFPFILDHQDQELLKNILRWL
jgi:hypothetical protein